MNHLLCLSLLIVFRLHALEVRPLPTPAGPKSCAPNLAIGQDGRVYLTWLENLANNDTALRFSTKDAEAWSLPSTIVQGSDLFVNYADFPSLIVLPDSSLVAHWLTKNNLGGYGIRMARSTDGGQTWGASFSPHPPLTGDAYCGFVSMFTTSTGALAAVWLDGRDRRDNATSYGDMTLRYARFDEKGDRHDERVIDPKVCSCCQTSAVAVANPALVVYRDCSDKDVRDIALLRCHAGIWSEPQTVHADHWVMHGCPVNGPSISAINTSVFFAWFTASTKDPGVFACFSADGGNTFGSRIHVDDGMSLGRVSVSMISKGNAFVAWLKAGTPQPEIRLRRIWADGHMDEPITVGVGFSGFPRIIRSNSSAIIAWTDSGQVKTAEVPLP